MCASWPYINSIFNFLAEDYTAVTVLLEFQPGETEKNITINILDDNRAESDEIFELDLAGGIGVHLSPFFRAEVIILDDDGNKYYQYLQSILLHNREGVGVIIQFKTG